MGRRQNPYRPMENDRLSWRADYGNALDLEFALGPIGEKKDKTKKKSSLTPQLVLLVGSGDAKDCCAQNFERTVFRDKKVVSLAKKQFANFRLERTSGSGNNFYAKFKLEKKKPAILLMDEEGHLVYKTQRCANPAHVFKGMLEAAALVKAREIYSSKTKKKLVKTREMIDEGQFRLAYSQLLKVKDRLLVKSVRDQVAKQIKSLKRTALQQLREARGLEKTGDTEGALDAYRKVERDFGKYTKARNYARKALKRLSAKQT